MKKTHKREGFVLSIASETLAQVGGAGIITSPVAWGITTSPDGIVTTPGVVQDPAAHDGQTTP
jgi:hypothetical protein